MITPEFLTSEVPDPDAASTFLKQLSELHPAQSASLAKDAALLSDILVLVSFSPLFAATLLQDPGYITWLRRERQDIRVRDKQALLESLARFAMTHSSLPANVLLARFRRRELMRIFLRDVRRVSTISEVTEEVSNLADAILEHALRISKQELDNRYGQAQEEDGRGRLRPSEFCVISLGKLGSLELNYSSDIDLLFIFSQNGDTSGSGTHGSTSNLDYFSKLTQSIIKLVGGQGGEGAAYRVDMRLRPHGRVGPLAQTLADTVRYYRVEAAAWERQVLIRSRASAGSAEIFRRFFRSVEDVVFSTDIDVETALANVALSKQKIDLRGTANKGIDIKLGTGGIREIEFIAQSLQLAYGGRDKWLRAPHTLVSLDRLAERGHISGKELADLFAAYDFLRYVEHVLQIENGLQTHLIPREIEKRNSIARRLGMSLDEFEAKIGFHTGNVSRSFQRVFQKSNKDRGPAHSAEQNETSAREKSLVRDLKARAPRFTEVIEARQEAIVSLPHIEGAFPQRDYTKILRTATASAVTFGDLLSDLRRSWYQQLLEIVAFDAFGKLELAECKCLQTQLAEASIAVALDAAKTEVEKRYGGRVGSLAIAVLALGKLGNGSLDYDSDLDLVIIFDPGRLELPAGKHIDELEFYSRVVEVFTNILSSVTRDGSLYRVDLRLRPHGSDGPLVISRNAIIDYFRSDAAIWELLAFVNLRAVGGEMEFPRQVEEELRHVIYRRAKTIGQVQLAAETREVRDRLEKLKASKRSGELDIKYGSGGLLDVYFALRFLQLLYGKPDVSEDRDTRSHLTRLATDPNLAQLERHLNSLKDGYEFLTKLDHSLRIIVGRKSTINTATGQVLAGVLSPSGDWSQFVQELTSRRIAIREAFERIVSGSR